MAGRRRGNACGRGETGAQPHHTAVSCACACRLFFCAPWRSVADTSSYRAHAPCCAPTRGHARSGASRACSVGAAAPVFLFCAVRGHADVRVAGMFSRRHLLCSRTQPAARVRSCRHKPLNTRILQPPWGYRARARASCRRRRRCCTCSPRGKWRRRKKAAARVRPLLSRTARRQARPDTTTKETRPRRALPQC